ncbi:MAG TPA: adenylate/guanylate cyclase domain-containing protein, partial [Ktedonobacteraceae bacterium]
MASLPEAGKSANNELRSISDTLLRISRLLHEHTGKLEVAVEGTYANEPGDARIRLLNDSLNVSRLADLELGRLSYALQRVQQEPQGRVSGRTLIPQAFEQERAELTTNITNLQQQRDEMETLYDIARVLNSTLEFDKVLSLVMDRVIEFVQAERGFLILLNPITRVPEFTIARNKQAQTLPAQAASAQISWGTVRRVITTLKPELADDAQQDDALRAQESIMAFGIRSIMCAPLIVRNNCIGAVYVDSRTSAHLFGPRHLDLLLAFCNQAAIAIDNARLFANLNRAIKQVQEDKQYMENIFGSIANGVITTNSEGTITTFNAAAQKILDIHMSSAIGKNYREVFQLLPAQVGLIPLLHSAQLQHDHGTIVNRAIECELPRRGWVNLNVYVTALRDTRNTHIGMALVIDDRTDLKRSEARTREIRGIFERYVHPNIVQQLVQDPLALKLGGETKEISVLFADIRGYTSMSERFAPEEMMDLINRYLKIMCEAIWEEEGTLTAFQGDALMAIFNAPLPQEMHALHAVRAAWKMRMAVLQYRQEHPQEMQINFGFGVNTGPATVGNLGSPNRIQNYTAIGDAVNVASRLQNNVTDNNILINETTYTQVYPYVRTG